MRRRSPREWRILLMAGLSLARVLCVLRLLPARWPALLPAPLPDDQASSDARDLAYAAAVDAWLARLRVQRPCLPRSIVLYRHLRARHIPAHLQLGVLRATVTAASRDLQGHAWLSLHDSPWCEPEPARLAHYLCTWSTARPAAPPRQTALWSVRP